MLLIEYMEKEIWKDVVGYEGLYQVSNLGKIRSMKKKHILKTDFRKDRKNSYFYVQLSKNGVVHNKLVHRAVGDAFLGIKKPNEVTRHLNGDNFDNRLENLKFGSSKENAKDRELHGKTSRGENHGHAKLDIATVRIIRFLSSKFSWSYKSLASLYGVSPTTVRNIVNRIIWKYVL